MSDSPAPAVHDAPQARPAERPSWGRRIVVGGVLLLVFVVLFFVGAAFLPRWWSHRIGDQVDGNTAQGIGVGLFYGAVFTLLPLLVLWLTFRRRRPWKVWLAGTIGALVLAAPNLLTLGIVVGTGNAAHAGERTLDVEAPSFRASTLIGALAAAALFAGAQWLLISRRRSRRAADTLRDELRARDETSRRETGPA